MTELMRDSLVLARNLGMDVFNALNLMQNQEFLQVKYTVTVHGTRYTVVHKCGAERCRIKIKGRSRFSPFLSTGSLMFNFQLYYYRFQYFHDVNPIPQKTMTIQLTSIRISIKDTVDKVVNSTRPWGTFLMAESDRLENREWQAHAQAYTRVRVYYIVRVFLMMKGSCVYVAGVFFFF